MHFRRVFRITAKIKALTRNFVSRGSISEKRMEDSGTTKFVGAIDEGTSSARFIIYRAGSDVPICSHQLDVNSFYPKEGWVEQDPIEIYEVVKKCINVTMDEFQKKGKELKDLVAVGITNQRESSVVWDRDTGKPLYNAIIWLDNRTSVTVDQLVASIPNNSKNIEYLKPLCGLPLSPYFSALKLRWLRDNADSVRKAMDEGNAMFGTIDTWLIYNLTGGARNGGLHLTDVTNASRTMLMNIETLQWDRHLLDFFGLPNSILPDILSSSELYGYVKETKIQGVPITADLGDQQAALVGQQCLQRGQAKATYGTGCFLLYNTGPSVVHSTHGLLTTVGYQLGRNATPMYALEGSVAIAGVALKWLRENLGLFGSITQVEPMASMVDNSLDVYFVPAFSGLYAPYWNQEARGIICGLSEDTTSEHVVRATLESICFQVRDILESMRKDCGIPLTKLMVDGGMTINNLFLQLQSDLVGINVIKSKLPETTALGAALAAYKAVEPSFKIETELSKGVTRKTYTPTINDNERDVRYDKWKMAVERAIGWDAAVPPRSDYFQ
uniref:Probable glycerol kinase n=1 Tax=Glossina austeni TaxID=7395 RepID=A0A1A9VGC9_GLOAU